MSLISLEILQGLGMGYSIAGLALVLPVVFIFRNYLRFLDHLQLLSLYTVAISLPNLPASNNAFVYQLETSWVAFPRNIFEYFCANSDFICTAGFPLSFGSCLLVFLLLMRVIVSIEKCRNGEIRFEPVYTFYKGFTRWVYMPLSFYSLYFLILTIKGQADNIISSVCVLGICVIFPVAQLIGYKCIQTEEDYIWRKWLQFANFYRLGIFSWLGAVGKALNQIGWFYAYFGVFAIYLVLFTWKNKFVYPIGGKIVFVIGELLMIGVLTLFLFYSSILQSLHLDFFAISLLLLIDVCYHISEFVYFRKYGVPKEEDANVIHPEDSNDGVSIQKRERKGFEVNESFEELDDYPRKQYSKVSRSSPKKSPRKYK